MSDDRFEIELRDVLREEATTAPVVLTIGELRARAGSRSRWAGLTGVGRVAIGVVGAAIVALALIIVANPTRPTQTLGTSPAPAPSDGPASAPASAPVVAPVSPSPGATPLPTVGPSRAPVGLDFGPRGSLVLARLGSDRITIVSVDPSGTERVLGLIEGLASLAPTYTLDQEDSIQAISPDGDVLIRVSPGKAGHLGTANVLVHLGDKISDKRTVPAGLGTFGPDGQLILSSSDAEGHPHLYIVDPDRLTSSEVPIPADVNIVGRRPTLTADGRGVFADRSTDPAAEAQLVVLGFDGNVVAAAPSADPQFVTGSERPESATGQRTIPGCDTGGTAGDCVLIVVDPGEAMADGTNVAPKGDFFTTSSWAPDGRSLVMRGGSGAIWRWDGTATSKVATVPADVTNTSTEMVGFTGGTGDPGSTSVLLSGDHGTTIQPLDGAAGTTVPGTLLQVVQ